MSRRTFTANELEKLKREAKKLAKSEGIPHVKALDRLANREGYQRWWHLQHNSEHATEPFPTLKWIVVPNFGKMPLVVTQALNGGLGYEVQCPFCGKAHTHGISEGSRLSHCADGGHEYYLRLADVSGPALPWGESGATAVTDTSSSGRGKHALIDLIARNGPCRSQSQPGPAVLFACILWNGHDGMHSRFGKTWTDSQGHMPSADEIARLEEDEHEVFGSADGLIDEDDE